MSFLKNHMPLPEILEGVVQFVPPSKDEVRQCDEIATALQVEEGKSAALLLPEFFMLKIALVCEFSLGMLEQLGMDEAGRGRFYELYTSHFVGAFGIFFKSSPRQSVLLLKERMESYAEALHRPHPVDPHLNVADRFTRAMGAPDEPALVKLCLNCCKSLNEAFLEEIKSLGREL
jgi:hypothetical protein